MCAVDEGETDVIDLHLKHLLNVEVNPFSRRRCACQWHIFLLASLFYHVRRHHNPRLTHSYLFLQLI